MHQLKRPVFSSCFCLWVSAFGWAKTVAGLRTMNEAVEYEYGVDRELHMHTGETVLRAALTAVGLFWNQLAVLHEERDGDFQQEPELIELRRRLAARLDAMADAVVQRKSFQRGEGELLANSALLESPRYGDYARITVARYEELQTLTAILNQRGAPDAA